jgi:DNA-binding transcriptional MerR regulator
MTRTSSTTAGLTVGQLARVVGLSRSTLLYYDRTRLLKPTGRSRAGYRLYTQADRERCEQVCFFRKMGIPLADIAGMLAQSRAAGETGRILERRLHTLEEQIDTLQGQQRDILRLLEQLALRPSKTNRGDKRRSPRARVAGESPLSRKHPFNKEKTVVNKQQWVAIMTAAGFSEQNMHDWHKTFERMEPQGHQEFLESLSLSKDEISRIREWSRK